MTDAACSHYAPVPALFNGAPLFKDSVALDLLGRLRNDYHLTGLTSENRRMSAISHLQDRALADILVRLYAAASNRLGGQEVLAFREELARIHLDAIDLYRERQHLDCLKISEELFVYRIELADADDEFVFNAAQRAWAHAKDVDGTPFMMRLALGLSLVRPDTTTVWLSPEGTVRQALASLADRRLPSGTGTAAKAAKDIAELLDLDLPEPVREPEKHADVMDDDRPPNRCEPATPTLVVVPSLDHLPKPKMGDRDRNDGPRPEYEPISEVPLALVTDADVPGMGRALRDEWPWAYDPVEPLLLDLVGKPHVQFHPTLLVGNPGAGKTRLARWLGEKAGLPVTVYNVAGVHDGAFGGTSRQWSSGRGSVSLQAIRRAQLANHLIVLDEVEKGGQSRHNGKIGDALIPMLEKETARRYFEPYLECPVDLSAVSYIATANTLDGVSEPVLDRMRIVHVPEPGPEHLGDIVRRIVEEIRVERGLGRAWLPDLAQDEIELLADAWPGGSLRILRRLVESVVAGRDAFALRH